MMLSYKNAVVTRWRLPFPFVFLGIKCSEEERIRDDNTLVTPKYYSYGVFKC